jgi:RHH-type proline utilization regulon transcriptional repressor/proline dehydrogenase/delta 1-pyrroline-5-carboxylate dehydrogenase
VLCLGPTAAAATEQAAYVTALGGTAVVAKGRVAPEALQTLIPLACVIWWGDDVTGRAIETALAGRDGPITALVSGVTDTADVMHERHVCIDTSSAGGNAALLAEIGA